MTLCKYYGTHYYARFNDANLCVVCIVTYPTKSEIKASSAKLELQYPVLRGVQVICIIRQLQTISFTW